MRYIPKEYKAEVEDIYRGIKEWNDVTRRWCTTLIVEWGDGVFSVYASSSSAFKQLKEFGREGFVGEYGEKFVGK